MEPTLCLAPLRGNTDNIYRSTLAKYFSGIDIAVAPFISTTSKKKVGPATVRDLMPEKNKRMPVIPQIIGNNADDFIVFAKKLAEIGYETVNWNLGCPHPMVARKKRGSGLLPFPEEIDSFLEKVISQIPISLSIKTRLGRHSGEEIFKLMPVFNRHPLTEVIFHPRTGIQMYGGKPDLDIFEQCLALCGHKVVYNGDINDVETFDYLAKRFPSIGEWMLGRGVLANPFLPALIKRNALPEGEPLEIIKKFHDDLFEQYSDSLSGASHITGRMKGFWSYIYPSFDNGKKPIKRIKKTTHIDQYKQTVDDFFENEAKWGLG